ncbi:MAG: hypothetical protein P8Y24_05775 [Gammaproteobacteria bacterium]|jgi:hypothetical protein
MDSFKRSPALPVFLIALSCLFFLTATSYADQNSLQQKYQQLKKKLDTNSYGVPVYIESAIEAQSQSGDVYGIIYHPYKKVKTAFSQVENWCEIAPLHLNVKACTFLKLNGDYLLTLYSGRKYFERPEDTYQLVYRYHLDNKQENYTRTILSAEDGPLGTSDYLISTEAMPLNDTETFIHFSYSYKQGFWTRMAMKTYLATLGRDKVGFTVIDTDSNGDPVYIDGVRGVIERNAIRYYYAIQAYLDTVSTAHEKLLLTRLNRWFDLTEQHHEQLYEMEKKEYLDYKQQERVEQNRLQQEIDKTSLVSFSSTH